MISETIPTLLKYIPQQEFSNILWRNFEMLFEMQTWSMLVLTSIKVKNNLIILLELPEDILPFKEVKLIL